jgi:hypothetical protein
MFAEGQILAEPYSGREVLLLQLIYWEIGNDTLHKRDGCTADMLADHIDDQRSASWRRASRQANSRGHRFSIAEDR